MCESYEQLDLFEACAAQRQQELTDAVAYSYFTDDTFDATCLIAAAAGEILLECREEICGVPCSLDSFFAQATLDVLALSECDTNFNLCAFTSAEALEELLEENQGTGNADSFGCSSQESLVFSDCVDEKFEKIEPAVEGEYDQCTFEVALVQISLTCLEEACDVDCNEGSFLVSQGVVALEALGCNAGVDFCSGEELETFFGGSSNAAAIVGGVVGGVVAIAGVVGVFFFLAWSGKTAAVTATAVPQTNST